MVEKKEKEMLEKLKKTFIEEDATSKYTKFYEYGGWKQSDRKKEFVETAKKIAADRKVLGYQREKEEEIGVPLGQRYLERFNVTGTDVICEYDDFQQINNAAIQQMSDDIKRTSICSLDMPHMLLQNRIGATITPETINHYFEVLNHAICGGAVVQEHMPEIHPGMVKDAHGKALTGDEELAARIDKQFLIDIEKEYPEEKAKKLKEGIGKHLYQVGRVPTIAVRIADGGIVHRWNGNQSALAFISAYKLGGGSILADFSLTAKHMQYILLGTPTWPRRGPRGQNEPGGMLYGYIGDICQTDAISNDPVLYCIEATTLGALYYVSIWGNNYVVGGIGSAAPAYSYTNNVFDDFVYHIAEWIKDKYGGFAKAKPSFDVVREVAEKASFYILEQYNKYPLLLESHWGGAIRFFLLQATASIGEGLATGNSLASFLALHYTHAFIGKEAWERLGFGAGDAVDHINLSNAVSLRPDEGVVPELRGPNIPSDSTSALIVAVEPTTAFSAHAGRGDAWVLSPVVKAAFSDPGLIFDFRRIRAEIAKGAIREFMPEGDRDLIKPAR